MAREPGSDKAVALNRKARHNYFIESTLEAGIQLTGTEVKAMRAGGVQITDSHAGTMGGELFLFNAHIPEYKAGNRFNHEPKRPRKLLVHRKELNRLLGSVEREGMTLVPLSIYFNPRGIAKVELGLAKGKKKWDKRETEKAKDWQREKGRLLRSRG